MRKVIFFLVVFLVFSLLSSLYSKEEKTYFASLLTKGQEPVLDGRLDERMWKDIPETTGFVIFKTEFLASKQTFFKICYNDEAIYIAVRCEEPEVDKIKVKFKNGESLWQEDSVEVFIFPKDGKTYFQFVVNTEGYRFNKAIGLEGKNLSLLDWQAKVFKGKGFYSMEIKIPFGALLAVPEKNAEWKINIARNILISGDRHTCWPYLKRSFHEIENFGKLVFPQEISEEKIKPEVIFYFKKEISANLDLLSNLKRDFSKKGEDLHLQREIDLFVKDCERIEKFFKSKWENLSVKKITLLLRVRVGESKELISRGEKIKKKILLKKQEILLESFFE